MTGATNARRLIQSGTLAQRRTSAERIAHMHEDVTDLTARIRTSLTAKSHEFTVTGWALDDESWEMAMNGRVIVVSVVLRRAA